MTACAATGFTQLAAVITFAVETACRRGEILALTWADVRQNSVVIRRSKTKRPRAVALSPLARDALARVRDLSPRNVWPDFAGPSGARVLERQWYRIMAHTGIAGLHFHDLRHEGVSRLFERGLSTPEVMQMSSHSTTGMLLRYTHLQVDHLAEKLAKVA
jgi:integrase